MLFFFLLLNYISVNCKGDYKMAKGKGGKPSSAPAARLRKNHGPKKKMWHCWSSTMRKHFADAGLLTKYHNRESFEQALTAKGIRHNIDAL